MASLGEDDAGGGADGSDIEREHHALLISLDLYTVKRMHASIEWRWEE
jgi:hypothetical protein